VDEYYSGSRFFFRYLYIAHRDRLWFLFLFLFLFFFAVSHISRPGETISSRGFRQRMGGKGFNQAVALSLATGGGGGGGKVSFYGTVGDDDAGRGLKEKLKSVWGLESGSLFLDEVCV
jgi:sugar/nucleoside kinase (ribokinase family)